MQATHRVMQRLTLTCIISVLLSAETNQNPLVVAFKLRDMELSAFERVFLVVAALLAVHRYLTGEWYIGLEVEQVEE